jgi:hypothetical protein
MPSDQTAPLFDAARRCRIGFRPGSAEIAPTANETGIVRKRWFSTSILEGPEGDVLLKYRKVHLPGLAEYDPGWIVQHLERRHSEVGSLGFPAIRAPMGGVAGINIGLDDLRRPPLAGSMARARAAKRGTGGAGWLPVGTMNRSSRIAAWICACWGRTTIFASDKYRRPEAYGRITGQAGSVEPAV